MNPELWTAVYAAFAGESPPSWFVADMPQPLEDLQWSDLESLADRTLVYDLEVLKYILPRWLELLTFEDYYSWEIDEYSLSYVLKGKHWRQWPSAQVEAIRAVFLLWAHARLYQGRMKDFADYIEELEDDVSPYFNPWLRARPLEVAQWIWKNNWTRTSALRRWIVSPRVEDKLEEVFFNNPSGEHAPLLSDVIQLVRALRALEA